MTDTIRWGVLGTGRIGTRKVIPAMQRGTSFRGRGTRVARSREGRGRGGRVGDRDGPRILRGAARRSGDRRDLQPAAESPARAVDDPCGRGRQARAVREADRAERRGGRAADRGPRPHRRADPGSVHGPQPPAVAARAGHRALRPDRRGARLRRFLQLLQRRSRQHPQRARVGRRRADGHRLLSGPHLALRVRIASRRGSAV